MNKRDFLKFLGTASVAAPVAAITSALVSPYPNSIRKEEAAVERILRTGIIRAGYIIYEPAFTKDPNTNQLSGFVFDLAEKIAANLKLRIEWVEEVSFGTALSGLETGRYDFVASPFWPNAIRARLADFCQPIFYSAIGVFVQQNDNRFNDLERINDPTVRISTIDGEMAAMLASERFPNAAQFSLPQSADISLMLLNVVLGKADVAITEVALANQFIKKNPGKLKNIAAYRPLQVFPNVFPVKRSETGLQNMINVALEELLNSGYVDQLLDAAEPNKGDYYRVALPYRTPQAVFAD
ncbi:MAG: substrate-binding periplasmic protein [Dongiaceae bacterium]